MNLHPLCVRSSDASLKETDIEFLKTGKERKLDVGEVYINPKSCRLCFYNAGEWPERGLWG